MLSTFILVEAPKVIILCQKTYLLKLSNNLHNINLLFVQDFFFLITFSLHQKGMCFLWLYGRVCI